MNNFSVKQQLGFAFSALAFMVVLVSGIAVWGLQAAGARFSDYVHGAADRHSTAGEIRAAASRRAIAVRNMVLVEEGQQREVERAAATEAHAAMQKHLQALKQSIAQAHDASDRERQLLADFEKTEAAYGPVALNILKLATEGKHEAAIAAMNSDCRPLLVALLKTAEDYVAESDALAHRATDAASASAASQRTLMLGVSAVAALLAIALGMLITRHLMGALGADPRALGGIAQRVARGDLRPVQGADAAPAGSVLASMGQMQNRLVDLIGQVRSAAESIATASAQIAQGNQDLSGRTEQQASALQQTAATMDQLGSTVRNNADNARQANQLAQGASQVAGQGGEVVTDVVQSMRGISDSSRRIAEIIGVIDGIAFQTNILALNAAVEAARAGEQGRGFAVVAGEVRNLAQRSAEAAREIKSLITSSVEQVEHGTSQVDKAGATMQEIVSSIRRVSDIVGEITAASSEQASGVSQVGHAVTQLDQATQQNAALVEESAAAAESLRLQAQQLVQSVSVFQLAESRA